MSTFIGRKKEIKRLQKIIQSDRSEFVAVFGRRRVGKTLLIREAFNNKFTSTFPSVFSHCFPIGY